MRLSNRGKNLRQMLFTPNLQKAEVIELLTRRAWYLYKFLIGKTLAVPEPDVELIRKVLKSNLAKQMKQQLRSQFS